jgi:hypothetical protein
MWRPKPLALPVTSQTFDMGILHFALKYYKRLPTGRFFNQDDTA